MAMHIGRVCVSVILACALPAPFLLGQVPPSPVRNEAGDPAENARLRSGSCLTVAQAAQRPNEELCVSAHIYDIVELPDGTRFLDVCPPTAPDSACGFTIISHPADRAEVGDLAKFRNQDVHIRGIVRVTHGRMGLTLSHVRQFRGGAEKFRPNPLLTHGFDGQSTRMPVKDPNLASSGRHRAFMNNREQEAVPGR